MKRLGDFFTHSVMVQMIMVILIITGLSFSGQMYFNITTHKKNLFEKTENYLISKVEEEAKRILIPFKQSQQISEDLAALVASDRANNSELALVFLQNRMEQQPLIAGGGFWMEPYAYDSSKELFGPYLYREDGSIQLTWEYSTQESNYLQYDWYSNGFLGEESVWSEPYTDSVTGIPMVTVTSPIIRDQKTIGVTTMDIGLKEMDLYISGLAIGNRGRAYVVSNDGYFIVSDIGKIMETKVNDKMISPFAGFADEIQRVEKPVMRTEKIGGESVFVTYTKIGDTGMSLILTLPEKELGIQRSIRNAVFMTGGSLIVCFFLLYLFISKMMIRYIKLATKHAETVAAGDLSNQLLLHFSERKDEFGRLGDALNIMITSLRGMIIHVKDIAEMVAASSEELSANGEQVGMIADQVGVAIQQVASSAEEQSSQIDKTAEHIDRLIDQVQHVAERSKQINSDAAIVMQTIESGNQSVEHSIKQVNLVKEQSVEVSVVIRELGDTSEQIGNIIELINGIATQTNLLALNAAIEAARAGEAGRGFSVVAEEIRHLAEESAQSTKRISNLVQKIQSDVMKVIGKMEENTEIVDTSVKAIEENGKIFRQIDDIARGLYNYISMVNGNANDMIEMSNEVQKAVKRIAQLSQDFASNAEEVAASSEEQTAATQEIVSSSRHLAELAEDLAEAVNRFKL